MKRGLVLALIFMVFVLVFIFALNFTGYVMGDPSGFGDSGGPNGPTFEEMNCMQICVEQGCEVGDRTCMEANALMCGEECGVDASGPPEPVDESETCMQGCIVEGCEEFDFECQENNMFSCEDSCGMKGDAPDESEMGEEQKCMSECVAEKDPEAICSNGPEGETGDRVCKKCAKECEHLYEGPCLGDKEIREKEKDCKTCKHCYGEPLMGDSGQGWECIVDVECNDASEEFGDESGEGPGIGQEGFVNREKFTERIGSFFKGLFGGRDKGSSESGDDLGDSGDYENFVEEEI